MLKNELQIEVPKSTMKTWPEIVDSMAEIINISAGLIMRLNIPHIEVFLSSETKGNPYRPGDKEKVWDSGLYCETVIKNKDKLLVPNALRHMPRPQEASKDKRYQSNNAFCEGPAVRQNPWA